MSALARMTMIAAALGGLFSVAASLMATSPGDTPWWLVVLLVPMMAAWVGAPFAFAYASASREQRRPAWGKALMLAAVVVAAGLSVFAYTSFHLATGQGRDPLIYAGVPIYQWGGIFGLHMFLSLFE